MKFIDSNKTLIGLILITVIVMIYSYHTNTPIFDSDLITVTGRLENIPIESYSGGDMPWYFIKFRFIGDKKTYYLKSCGYDMIDKDYILGLNSGDSVSIKVKRTDILEDKLYVLTFATVDRPNTLNLKAYNRCYTKYWEKLKPFILIMLLILLFRILQHFGLVTLIKNVVNNKH